MAQRAGARLTDLAKQRRIEQRNRIGWRYVPAILVYCAVSSLFIVHFAWRGFDSLAWFSAGFAGGTSLLLLWVAADSVAANRLDMAAFAEDQTSRDIRQLRNEGWRVIDNIPFDGLDVDHVAIGPGGVVVLETKWTSQSLIDSQNRLTAYGAKAIDQVDRNARKIQAVLRQNGYVGDVTSAAVVARGAGIATARSESQGRHGQLIDGTHLQDYLRSLHSVLSTEEIMCASNALERFLDIRLERIASVRKSPPAAVNR